MQYAIGAGGCLLLISLTVVVLLYTQTIVRPETLQVEVCPSIARLAVQAHEDNKLMELAK